MASKAETHRKLSYWKSAYRLLGYVLLFWSVPVAAVFLILSEAMGVAEEMFGS